MATPRGWLINRCEPLLGNVGRPPGVNAYRTLPGFHTLCLTGSREGLFLAGSQKFPHMIYIMFLTWDNK